MLKQPLQFDLGTRSGRGMLSLPRVPLPAAGGAAAYRATLVQVPGSPLRLRLRDAGPP